MDAFFRSLLLCAVAIWTMSCGGAKEKAYTMDYFSGSFVYFADAAHFYDCATGVEYPVSQSKGYLTAERKYLNLNPTQGERISVEFHGHIEQLPPMEGDGTVATMVIDTLKGFDRTAICDPNSVLSGMYNSSDSTRVETLKLSSDYTFTRTQFVSHRDEVIISGVWGLSSALELVLKPLSLAHTRSTGLSSISSGSAEPVVADDVKTPAESRIETFQIIPDQHTLVANGGGEILGFKRVFMN